MEIPRRSWEPSDAAFEAMMLEIADRNSVIVDRLYYSRVAGIVARNPDGTDRQTIASQLEPLSPLALQPEPDNRFDPNAIALVHRQHGTVGYIPRDTAEWLAKSLKNETWVALVREVRAVSATGPIGMVVVLARLKPK